MPSHVLMNVKEKANSCEKLKSLLIFVMLSKFSPCPPIGAACSSGYSTEVCTTLSILRISTAPPLWSAMVRYWIAFAETVPAKEGRKCGYKITETEEDSERN